MNLQTPFFRVQTTALHFCLQTLLCKRYYFTPHVCKIVNAKSRIPLATDCSGQNWLDMSGTRGKKSDSEVKRARKKLAASNKF